MTTAWFGNIRRSYVALQQRLEDSMLQTLAGVVLANLTKWVNSITGNDTEKILGQIHTTELMLCVVSLR